jgi:hypothetical protein
MCLPALHTASVLCLVVLFCWLLLLVLFGSWNGGLQAEATNVARVDLIAKCQLQQTAPAAESRDAGAICC